VPEAGSRLGGLAPCWERACGSAGEWYLCRLLNVNYQHIIRGGAPNCALGELAWRRLAPAQPVLTTSRGASRRCFLMRLGGSARGRPNGRSPEILASRAPIAAQIPRSGLRGREQAAVRPSSEIRQSTVQTAAEAAESSRAGAARLGWRPQKCILCLHLNIIWRM